MKNKFLDVLSVLLLAVFTTLASAQPVATPPAPVHQDTIRLDEMVVGKNFQLQGLRNAMNLEFGLRNDRVVRDASLELVFTPSPALLPRLSHLRVYLNDELMGVVPIEEESGGAQIRHTLALEPLLFTRFNRLQLEFVGHYTDVCEDLSHSALWLDVSPQTHIHLQTQSLIRVNDLAYFPEPFFDGGDMRVQQIPFVFAHSPASEQLRAAAVLASYFGTQAQWRDMEIPVYYNELPAQHAIIFATPDSWPDFLAQHPRVDEPTVELIRSPAHPYAQLLLILGRDDEDLLIAASALAAGAPVFRGQSVTIDGVVSLAPRQPYDAPNWVPIDRPVSFAELMDYDEQFETRGIFPRPIELDFRLPPDLFVWRNSGVPLRLFYRYTEPGGVDDSRLTLSLNNRFVDSYRLKSKDESGVLSKMRLPLRGAEVSKSDDKTLIPAIRVGERNQLRFEFSFASMTGAIQRDSCQTILPADVRAAIDEDSTLDFSGFPHYMEMPNLAAFAQSGFPFSRMADLSETIAVIDEQPEAMAVGTLLETVAHIGAQVGYPAFGLRIEHRFDKAAREDVDILLLGDLPDAMKARPDGNLLLKNTQATLSRPFSQRNNPQPGAQVKVRSVAPMAALIEMQAEHFPGRSIVGLLARTERDYALLQEALASAGKRDVMDGAVVIIRESGVYSEQVGPTYHVGQIHWWEKIWYRFADSPLLIALAAFGMVLIITLVLWGLLRTVARRRLKDDGA